MSITKSLSISNAKYIQRAEKIFNYYGFTIDMGFNLYLIQLIRDKKLRYDERIPLSSRMDYTRELNKELRTITLAKWVVGTMEQANININELFDFFLAKTVYEGITFTCK